MTLKVDGTNGVLQAYDYQVLTTGFSYTFAAGTQTLFMNPAGTLATGTVTMPASPADGMTITFSSSQEVTALTVAANTGQSIVAGGAVTLAKNASLSYTYRLANTTWYPQQNASFPIGVGQTFTSVTGSRAFATTYTNTTGKPILCVIAGSSGAGLFGSMSVSINSGTACIFAQGQNNSGATACAGSFIVPANATYYVTQNNSGITNWFELR